LPQSIFAKISGVTLSKISWRWASRVAVSEGLSASSSSKP
jgi:hypothetical protein